MPTDITTLPSEEDDRYEYKSSRIDVNDLKKAVGKAASAFWNSGGGALVAGVDGGGRPDGGVPLSVGRQSLRDWLDQAIAAAEPVGSYVIQVCDGECVAGGTVDNGKAIVVVDFKQSHLAPHMAPDHRYYVRAGAHTVPAGSFLVEALWARRRLQQPRLVHMLRPKPDLGDILQLYVVNVSPEPALDVVLEVDPIPELFGGSGSFFPLVFPVVDRETPIAIDISTWFMSEQRIGGGRVVRLAYQDIVGNKYSYEEALYVRSFSPCRIGGEWTRDLVKAVEKLEKSVEKIGRYVRNRQQENGAANE